MTEKQQDRLDQLIFNSEELIHYLHKNMPLKLTNPYNTQSEIMYEAGRHSMIDFLFNRLTGT